MDFIDSMISERLGDLSFFNTATRLYKFEKLKKLTNDAKINNPDIPLINMGVGEPDKIAHSSIIDVLCRESHKNENRFYADNGILEFQEAACRFMKNVYHIDNLTCDNVMHGIGSKSILAMIPIGFINPGDVCLMTVPGYPIMGTYTKFLGGEVYNLPLCEESNFFPDLENIPKDILNRAKLIYINYPNNPTGQIATKEYYEYLVDFCRKNKIFIISDMAYGALTYGDHKPLSILSVDGAMDLCLEIHSLSKSFNMTGFRIAFVVGSPKTIKLYSTIKGHTDSGQFIPIQKAASFALDHYEKFISENIERYSRRFDLLIDVLRKVGFKVEKPKGGFYLYVPIPKGAGDVVFNSAEDAFAYILNNAMISTVPWDDCGAYLRLSVTYEAYSKEDEISLMKEIYNRLKSLDLKF
ncbi:aminotransferase class I/II-fold pyridoxal phosphate-dependent enzyme [Terrisporobacter petrolearius]|uniref:aminotransferase class I/II-fold pyridoxal phosphate-dependent enzyme n=1 Tax=Terrisporobacter petrolearius TaxID=1460447 RepID=UPI0031CC8524